MIGYSHRQAGANNLPAQDCLLSVCPVNHGKPCYKTSIDKARLVKKARYWSHSFFHLWSPALSQHILHGLYYLTHEFSRWHADTKQNNISI